MKTKREPNVKLAATCPQCGRSVNDVPFMPGPNGKPVCMDCAFNFKPRLQGVVNRDAATLTKIKETYELN